MSKQTEQPGVSLDTAWEAFKIADAKRKVSVAPATEQPDELSGDSLPSGMVKISKLIADLQSTMGQFGDTCVYIKPGVSWGAVALNRQSDDAEAIENTAASFAATFKSEYSELAQQIMGHAISEGWTHPSSPERESIREWQPPHAWPRYGMGIVRSRLLEDHVYLQGKNGDIWRVWLEMDGLPSIECVERNAALPKTETKEQGRRGSVQPDIYQKEKTNE